MRLIANSYDQIANSYEGMGDYQRALAYHDSSLQLWQEIQIPTGIAHAQHNLGCLHQKLDKHDLAILYLRKSIIGFDTLANYASKSLAMVSLAESFDEQGKFNQSFVAAKDALDLAIQNNSLFAQESAYTFLFQLSKDLGILDDALMYHEKSVALHDSIFGLKQIHKIAGFELEITFESEREATKIKHEAKVRESELELEVEKSKSESRSRLNLILILTALVLGLMLIAILALLRIRKKRNKLEKEKLQQEHVQYVLEQKLTAVSKTLNKIASILHTDISYQLNLALKRQDINEKDKVITNALEITRDISLQLDGRRVKDYANIDLLEVVFNQIIDHPTVHLVSIPDTAFIHDIVLKERLMRLLSELSQNSLKHSNANHIHVQLVQERNTLLLNYEDDGIGVDFQSITHAGGFIELTDLFEGMNAEFQFESKPHQGFSVTAAIPVQ